MFATTDKPIMIHCYKLKSTVNIRVYSLCSTFYAAPAAAAKSLQSCSTLCDPIDGSPSGSPVPGILQARTLEWVAISFSSAWKWKVKSESEVARLCLTLRDSMDCSPPGSSIHGDLLFHSSLRKASQLFTNCSLRMLSAVDLCRKNVSASIVS